MSTAAKLWLCVRRGFSPGTFWAMGSSAVLWSMWHWPHVVPTEGSRTPIRAIPGRCVRCEPPWSSRRHGMCRTTRPIRVDCDRAAFIAGEVRRIRRRVAVFPSKHAVLGDVQGIVHIVRAVDAVDAVAEVTSHAPQFSRQGIEIQTITGFRGRYCKGCMTLNAERTKLPAVSVWPRRFMAVKTGSSEA